MPNRISYRMTPRQVGKSTSTRGIPQKMALAFLKMSPRSATARLTAKKRTYR
jgi:hypothetical protein